MDNSGTSSPEHAHGFTSLTHHCILHAVHAIAPQKGISELLPQSGSHNITSFCKELAQLARNSSGEKSLVLIDGELVPQITIQNFYSDVMSPVDFTSTVEKALVDVATIDGLDIDRLHKICWDYYREVKKGEISFPKWLSSVCMYRLWLVFNQCLDDGRSCCMATVTMNEILNRITVLCSYTWSESYKVEESGRESGFTFPQFLECITEYFEMFKLSTSLTAEVISDLVDEIVHGVLKKGYLEKKGHVRRNWRRRWFILKRTILTYYSTDKKILKGELVLNSQTKVSSLEDKGNRHNMFLVTCGATEKPFTISADDQKMKHDWMLAIRKAIALAKVAEEGEPHSKERRELEQALSGFFLLKYGTDQPLLHRQDSDIRQIKHLTSRRQFRNIQKVAKELEAPPTDPDHSDDEERDDYVPMKPGGFTHEALSSSSDDEDKYCQMERPVLNSHGSSISGRDTPSTTGADSILTFSLPISVKSGSHDDVFNPDKAGLKSPGSETGSKGEAADGRAGLEDSYYEDCGPEVARYLPGERYVDVKHSRNLEESGSPPKAPAPDPSPPQNSYLTILPSPKATPPPEDLPSPARSTAIGPPLPPRRSTSPNPSRRSAVHNSPSSPILPPFSLPTGTSSTGDTFPDTSEPPPPPPPRSAQSPVTSPTHTATSPSPKVPSRRKISAPHSLGLPPDISESAEYREDVSSLMKKAQSSAVITDSNKMRQKPAPPPRTHPQAT